jgi:hypothetical protein
MLPEGNYTPAATCFQAVLTGRLLIGGILAALRQIFHLSSCPNLPGHL